jgi:hypothetical protein
MNTSNLTAGRGFGGLRSLEPMMEVGLAVAAAGFTLAIWLLGSTPQDPAWLSSGATHVTFPTVVVSTRANR